MPALPDIFRAGEIKVGGEEISAKVSARNADIADERGCVTARQVGFPTPQVRRHSAAAKARTRISKSSPVAY
jgi:hypothetical protein